MMPLANKSYLYSIIKYFKSGNSLVKGGTVIILLTILPMIYSCSEDTKGKVENVDPETFPTMTTTDVSTLVSDSGYTKYHLTADIWKIFDEASEPYWDFPTGLFMEKYDKEMEVESTFSSDKANYLSNKKLWRFDGNVRMLNTAGDRFTTEQIFWDQQEKKVYSDSFIRIVRPDRILEGYGFVSNEEMTEYTILNVSGVFPAPERKPKDPTPEESNDSLVSEADKTVQNDDKRIKVRNNPKPMTAENGNNVMTVSRQR